MALVDTVFRAIRQHDLIRRDSRVVVAVSGGADSLALLHILRELSATLACHLHVATLDHRLRGDAGAEDVRFVERTAREWQLPVTVGAEDVAQLARQQGMSIEAAARQARYDFLASVARQVDSPCVAVAHHADDQAETILLHLVRGAGEQGLAGMAFRASLPREPEIHLIRPLLLVTRAQIAAYCREHDLRPREDATNLDTTYLRNHIRWQTLPHLRTINPRVEQALSRLGEIASVEHDFLDQQLEQAIAGHETAAPDRVLMDRRVFQALHPALQRRWIRRAVEQLAASPENLGYQHVIATVAVGARGEVGARALLPGGLRLRVEYAAIAVERAGAPPERGTGFSLDCRQEIPVAIPGVTPVPGDERRQEWELMAARAPIPEFHARLAIAVGSRAVLRTRRRGDMFAPLGLAGHRQPVNKWMIDHKAPRAARDRIPLLVVDGEIAAILTHPQWTISHKFAVSEESQPVVYFRAEEFLKG